MSGESVETQLAILRTHNDYTRKWMVEADKKFAELQASITAGQTDMNTKLDTVLTAVNIQKGKDLQKAATWSIGGGVVGTALGFTLEHLQNIKHWFGN